MIIGNNPTRMIKKTIHTCVWMVPLFAISVFYTSVADNEQPPVESIKEQTWKIQNLEPVNNKGSVFIQTLDINNSKHRINYHPVEQQILTEGHFPDFTLARIKPITDALPDTMPQRSWDRLKFLFNKNLPSTTSNTLFDHVNRYYHYQKSLSSFQESGLIKDTPNPQNHLSLLHQKLEKTLALQHHFFEPEIVSQWFSRSNLTMNYLYQRQAIWANAQLPAGQKETALLALKKNYKNNVQLIP